VPPLQSEVSAPLDGGWGVTLTNTSTVAVDGLNATIAVADGGPALTFDFAGMSDAGTSCTSASAGEASCAIGTLNAGDSDTINALLETTGLKQGTSISGSVNVTSSNASSESSSLGAIGVVVITDGAAAVAAPNVAVASSSKNPSAHLPAKVTLELPKKIPALGPSNQTGVPFGAGKVKGPPVSVQLTAQSGSSDTELCPPSSGGCEGDIIDIEGNFGAYTSNSKPISAVVEIFYGSTVPAGSIYYQDAPNDTPTALPACAKTDGEYNTPCVDGAEQVVGGSGKKSTEDTIFFTGADPLVGRR